jgi:hypothetical protein
VAKKTLSYVTESFAVAGASVLLVVACSTSTAPMMVTPEHLDSILLSVRDVNTLVATTPQASLRGATARTQSAADGKGWGSSNSVLMSSTPLTFPQVISRTFAPFRVVNFRVSAG